MSPITLIKIYLVFNKLDAGYVFILEEIYEEKITKGILFGCLEPNNEKDFLFIFIKNTWKYHQNLGAFHS